MLRKLLKYEIKVTGRYVLPILGTTILMALMNMVIDLLPYSVPTEIIKTISVTLAVITLVASILLTFFLFIQRFYKSISGREGYLSHTLPVTVSQLMLSKWICAFVGITVVSITALLMGLLLIPSDFFPSLLEQLDMAKASFNSTFSISFDVFIAWMVAYVLILIAVAILMCYTSIAVGQTMNKSKAIFSFVAFFVLYAIMQTFNLIAIFIYFLPNMEAIIKLETLTEIAPLMIILILVYIAYAFVYFFITRRILTRKLNLE